MKTLLKNKGEITHIYSHFYKGKRYYVSMEADNKLRRCIIPIDFINSNIELIHDVINGEAPREHVRLTYALHSKLINSDEVKSLP